MSSHLTFQCPAHSQLFLRGYVRPRGTESP
jgi:hypothetical protein